MPSLPPFDVVVWVRTTPNIRALRDQLLKIADDDPDESTEYDGMLDFHWRFGTREAAERVANSLSTLCAKPEIVLLRLSNYDDPAASFTFKDERKTQQ